MRNKPNIIENISYIISAALIAFTLSLNAVITDSSYMRMINMVSLALLFYIFPLKYFLKNFDI